MVARWGSDEVLSVDNSGGARRCFNQRMLGGRQAKRATRFGDVTQLTASEPAINSANSFTVTGRIAARLTIAQEPVPSDVMGLAETSAWWATTHSCRQ